MRRVFFYSLLMALTTLLLIPVGDASAAPVPAITIDAPNTALIGETFTIDATFQNTGDQTGYGPFIDIFLPSRGADGDDGLTFVEAIILGGPAEARVLTFPDGGADGDCVRHPYLREQVCGTAGNTLAIIELPLGSVVPGQRVTEIDISVLTSPLADIGVTFNLRARGGFRFGISPVDDPCCDEPFAGSEVNASVTPSVLSVSKDNSAPEYEIATGPNGVHTWTLSVDIADGATLPDLRVIDALPAQIEVVPGSVASAPPNNGSNIAGGELIVEFGPITGTAAADDIIVTFDFTAPVNQNPDLSSTADNVVRVDGVWTPNDSRDGAQVNGPFASYGCPNDDCPGGAAPILLPFAAQKVVTGDVSPGSTLTYSVNFQVSDYAAFEGVTISDQLPDGLQYIGGSAALTYEQQGAVVLNSAAMGANAPAGNLNGPVTLTFDVSAQIGDVLIGGCVPPGGGVSDCVTFDSGAPTTGTLTYDALVLENFQAVDPEDTSSVDQGDVFINDAIISGDAVDPGDLTTVTAPGVTNDTTNEAEVERGQPEKTVYATTQTVAGNTVTNLCPCDDAQLTLAPGDSITYRIQQNVPISSYEDFFLTDYVPLPIFPLPATVPFNPVISGDIPPEGTAKFGPTETLFNIAGAPAVLVDAPTNSITFSYGDFNDVNNTETTVDLLFTVTMNDLPIADGLFLANTIERNEGSTNGGNDSAQDIAQVTVTGPLLRMSKGAVSSTGTEVSFEPPTVGPVVFNPPGSVPSFQPVINSIDLDDTPIDSNVSGVQPGDLVTFAVIIENEGSSRKGAFDIRVRDIIPEGFIIPAAGANLQVRLGTGAPVDFNGTVQSFFTDAGIELTDPDVDNGVCGPYADTGGANIIVITYDLQLQQTPPGNVRNTSETFNYSSEEGGSDHTGDQDITTTSTVFFSGGGGDDGGDSGTADGGSDDGQVTLIKSAGEPFVQPGDPLTWTITVTNTSGGLLTDLTVTDSVPPEVEVISLTSSTGSVSSNGGIYTITIDQLEATASATITIEARVRTDLSRFEIVNTATASTGASAQSTVVVAGTMPATGESPAWRDRPNIISGAALFGLGLYLWLRH